MRGHHMGNGEMRGDMFAKLDANSAGKVTKAEFTAKPLEMFGKADANKDGTVTPEARKAAWEKMRIERKTMPPTSPRPDNQPAPRADSRTCLRLYRKYLSVKQ